MGGRWKDGREREAGCDATTHNDDLLVDCTRCSRKTRREEETSRQDMDKEKRLRAKSERGRGGETGEDRGREEIEMEEREITELANMKIARYSRVT